MIIAKDLLHCSSQTDLQFLGQNRVLLPQFGILKLWISESSFQIIESE